MQLRRKTSTLLVGVTLIGGGLVGAIATAAPASAQERCTYGSSSGNTYTCANANNGGVDAQATIRHSGRTLDVCLVTYQGAPIGCTGYQYVRPGNYLRYGFRGQPAPNTYCALTYRSGTLIGRVCAASTY